MCNNFSRVLALAK